MWNSTFAPAGRNTNQPHGNATIPLQKNRQAKAVAVIGITLPAVWPIFCLAVRIPVMGAPQDLTERRRL
jgi:hypothetical protein